MKEMEILTNGEIIGRGIYCECGRELKQGYLSFINRHINFECECEKEKRDKQDKLYAEFERKADIIKLIEYSGLTNKQKECTFDSFKVSEETERVVTALLSYVEKSDAYLKQGKGIYFTGNTGSGKTHLACAVANALLNKGVKVSFEIIGDLARRIRFSYQDNFENESEILQKAYNSKVLVLDDLGAEEYTEKVQDRIHNIIDYRLRHRLATIITSNFKPEGLIKILDERTIDRITDKFETPFVVLTLRCKSYRQQSIAK